NAVNLIEYYKDKWKISRKNPLDCLFLTNKSVADYIGISKLYNVMKQANLYKKGLGFEQLNVELLSKEYEKLGEVQKTLSNLFNLISIVDSKSRTVNNILVTSSIKRNINLLSLNKIIEHLENIKGESLEEILNSIDREYQKSAEPKFKTLINVTLNLD